MPQALGKLRFKMVLCYQRTSYAILLSNKEDKSRAELTPSLEIALVICR